MKIYYSPSTNGFYMTTINKVIPDDKIEITKKQHQDLLQGGEVALGPSGMPENKPSRWHTLNSEGDEWEITAENQALKDAKEAEQLRKSEIKAERDSSGLKDITIQQAHSWIDNKFADVTDIQTLAVATKQTLKKFAAFIID